MSRKHVDIVYRFKLSSLCSVWISSENDLFFFKTLVLLKCILALIEVHIVKIIKS